MNRSVTLWYFGCFADNSFSATYTASSIQPGQTSSASQHQMLKDTSIAAIDYRSGDQRFFFQEASGNLRQAIYLAKNQMWAAGTSGDFQLLEDARKLTPLSAFVDPYGDLKNQSDVSTGSTP